MAQNRDAPAFQEYAASMMAKTDYRVLSLQERGLLYTLRLECWVNHHMPSNPATLARVLGFDLDEIAGALPGVMPFFAEDGAHIYCPELEDYRGHLTDRKAKLSEAGKRGAEKTNNRTKAEGSATPAATLSGTPRPGRGPLVKQSKAQPSKDQFNTNTVLKEGSDNGAWLNDYERASNGG